MSVVPCVTRIRNVKDLLTYLVKDHCWLKKPLRYPTKHHEEAVTYYKLAQGKLSNIFAKII